MLLFSKLGYFAYFSNVKSTYSSWGQDIIGLNCTAFKEKYKNMWTKLKIMEISIGTRAMT